MTQIDHPKVLQILKQKLFDGIDVQIVTNLNKTNISLLKEFSSLQKPVLISNSKKKIEYKFCLIDGIKILNGSLDYTEESLSKNYNQINITDNFERVHFFKKLFKQLTIDLAQLIIFFENHFEFDIIQNIIDMYYEYDKFKDNYSTDMIESIIDDNLNQSFIDSYVSFVTESFELTDKNSRNIKLDTQFIYYKRRGKGAGSLEFNLDQEDIENEKSEEFNSPKKISLEKIDAEIDDFVSPNTRYKFQSPSQSPRGMRLNFNPENQDYFVSPNTRYKFQSPSQSQSPRGTRLNIDPENQDSDLKQLKKSRQTEFLYHLSDESQ